MAGTVVPGAASALFVVVVLGAIGLFALATGIGLWRWNRWAWMATLVLQAISVLQLLKALASEGLAGLATFGLVPALVALLVFYYLNRPHVRAAFGHRPRPVSRDRTLMRATNQRRRPRAGHASGSAPGSLDTVASDSHKAAWTGDACWLLQRLTGGGARARQRTPDRLASPHRLSRVDSVNPPRVVADGGLDAR